jgi:hypothetical protein
VKKLIFAVCMISTVKLATAQEPPKAPLRAGEFVRSNAVLMGMGMGADIDVHESVVGNPGSYTVCVLANVSAR